MFWIYQLFVFQEKVISKYDQKVCELIKQYNALCHKSNVKEKAIKKLQVSKKYFNSYVLILDHLVTTDFINPLF